jgi:hypothetical protein
VYANCTYKYIDGDERCSRTPLLHKNTRPTPLLVNYRFEDFELLGERRNISMYNSLFNTLHHHCVMMDEPPLLLL